MVHVRNIPLSSQPYFTPPSMNSSAANTLTTRHDPLNVERWYEAFVHSKSDVRSTQLSMDHETKTYANLMDAIAAKKQAIASKEQAIDSAHACMPMLAALPVDDPRVAAMPTMVASLADLKAELTRLQALEEEFYSYWKRQGPALSVVVEQVASDNPPSKAAQILGHPKETWDAIGWTLHLPPFPSFRIDTLTRDDFAELYRALQEHCDTSEAMSNTERSYNDLAKAFHQATNTMRAKIQPVPPFPPVPHAVMEQKTNGSSMLTP